MEMNAKLFLHLIANGVGIFEANYIMEVLA